jgi:hypothetical protein
LRHACGKYAGRRRLNRLSGGAVLGVTPSNKAATQPTPNPALAESVVRGNEWARKLRNGEVRCWTT